MPDNSIFVSVRKEIFPFILTAECAMHRHTVHVGRENQLYGHEIHAQRSMSNRPNDTCQTKHQQIEGDECVSVGFNTNRTKNINRTEEKKEKNLSK